MAENKKGFILYADLIHTVEKMSANKAGLLFKHILRYVNDQDPKTNDPIIGLSFEPIKQQLKRDLEKYRKKQQQWSAAGKQSAIKRSVYSEIDFLDRWKKARLHFDKLPTNISKLTFSERVGFKNICRTYTPKEIDMAITGLFQQKTYKTTRLRPTHFLELEHFEKYLTCYTTKEKLFYNNTKKIDRI